MEAVATSAKNGQHPLSGALVQVVMLHKRAHRNVGDRRKLAAQTLRLYFFRTHQLNQDCFLCMQAFSASSKISFACASNTLVVISSSR